MKILHIGVFALLLAGCASEQLVVPAGPAIVTTQTISGPLQGYVRDASGNWLVATLSALPGRFVCRPVTAADLVPKSGSPAVPIIAVGEAFIVGAALPGPFTMLKENAEGNFEQAVVQQVPAGYLCRGVMPRPAAAKTAAKPQKKKRKKKAPSIQGDPSGG